MSDPSKYKGSDPFRYQFSKNAEQNPGQDSEQNPARGPRLPPMTNPSKEGSSYDTSSSGRGYPYAVDVPRTESPVADNDLRGPGTEPKGHRMTRGNELNPSHQQSCSYGTLGSTWGPASYASQSENLGADPSKASADYFQPSNTWTSPFGTLGGYGHGGLHGLQSKIPPPQPYVPPYPPSDARHEPKLKKGRTTESSEAPELAGPRVARDQVYPGSSTFSDDAPFPVMQPSGIQGGIPQTFTAGQTAPTTVTQGAGGMPGLRARSQWTADEDATLMRERNNGTTFQDIVANYLTSRSHSACRARYSSLNADVTLPRWRSSEEAILAAEVARVHPTRPEEWDAIATLLPGRTGNACRRKAESRNL